jgi:hypothetical protein
MADVIINLPGQPFNNVQSVATFTALRTLVSTAFVDGQDIIVDGTASIGDGGGGVFVWADLSVLPDDGINVIKPNDVAPLAAGRWIKLNRTSNAVNGPSILPEKFYLTERMTDQELTDAATQTGAIVLTDKMQSMINDAAGRQIVIPEGAVLNFGPDTIRTGGGVIYKPTTGFVGQYAKGLKIAGSQGTIIKGPANGYAIDIDTGVAFKFLDHCEFSGFTIDGANQAGSKGIRMARAYRVRNEFLSINNVKGDAFFVEVANNDADSSNRIHLYMCNTTGIGGWGFNHAPFAVANDLSYLTIENCLFNACGTDERKLITSITKAANGVVTCPAHGFVNGQRVRMGGVFGMFEINTAYVAIVAVIDANSFSTGINTSGFSTYTASPNGGYAFPAEPASGAIKMQTQCGTIRMGGTTETKNVAVYMRGKSAPGFRNLIGDGWTCENTTGISVLVDGANGLTLSNSEYRTNSQVAENYAHVLLDSSLTIVTGVAIHDVTIARFEGTTPIVANGPHTAFQAVGSIGGTIDLERVTWAAYDYTNQKRLGDNLFNYVGVNISDNSSSVFATSSTVTTNLTGANPSYTPDIKKGNHHLIILGATVAGTLTVNNPNSTGFQGNALNGQELSITIINQAPGTINISWGFSTAGAPTTIATGVNKLGNWRFYSATSWIQSATWV